MFPPPGEPRQPTICETLQNYTSMQSGEVGGDEGGSNELEFLGVFFDSSSGSNMSEFLGVFRGGSSGGVGRNLVVTSGKLF